MSNARFMGMLSLALLTLAMGAKAAGPDPSVLRWERARNSIRKAPRRCPREASSCTTAARFTTTGRRMESASSSSTATAPALPRAWAEADASSRLSCALSAATRARRPPLRKSAGAPARAFSFAGPALRASCDAAPCDAAARTRTTICAAIARRSDSAGPGPNWIRSRSRFRPCGRPSDWWRAR